MINNRSSLFAPAKNSLYPQEEEEEDIFLKDKDFYKLDQLKLSNKKDNTIKLGWALFASLFFIISLALAKQQSNKIGKFFDNSTFTEEYMDSLVTYMNDNDLDQQPIMIFDLKTIQLTGNVYMICAIISLILYNFALLIRKRFICCAKFRNVLVHLCYTFCSLTIVLFLTWWYNNYDVLHKSYDLKSQAVSDRIQQMYNNYLKGVNQIIFSDYDSTFEAYKSSLSVESQENLNDVYDQTKKCSILPLYIFIMFIVITIVFLGIVFFIKNTENKALTKLIKSMYEKYQNEPKQLQNLSSKYIQSSQCISQQQPSQSQIQNININLDQNLNENQNLNLNKFQINNGNLLKNENEKNLSKNFGLISPIFPQKEEKTLENPTKIQKNSNLNLNKQKQQQQEQENDQNQKQNIIQNEQTQNQNININQNKNKNQQTQNLIHSSSSSEIDPKTQPNENPNKPQDSIKNSHSNFSNNVSIYSNKSSKKSKNLFNLGPAEKKTQNNTFFENQQIKSQNENNTNNHQSRSNLSRNSIQNSNRQENHQNNIIF